MNENDLYPNNTPAGGVQPGIAISPEVNPAPVSPRRKLWKIPAAIALVIVIVGGFAAFGYNQGYSVKGLNVLTPNKVWEKFYTSEAAKVYNTTFSADYNDPEALEDPDNEFGIVLKNVKAHLEGSTYADVTDPEKPQVDGNIKFTLGSGNTSFSSGIEYKAVNNTLFYKIGDIPFLSGLIGSQNKNVEWVKINLDAAKSQSSEEGDFFKGLSDVEFQEKIRKIWVDNRGVKLSRYIGREKVNNVSTLHFNAVLDKEAVKKAMAESINELATLDKEASFTEDEKVLINTTIEKLVNKVEVKELEVWIGVQDQNLYKIHLVSNAPSIVSLIKTIESESEKMDSATSTVETKKAIEDFINKLSFSATFKFDATYNDYGKTKTIEEPAEAVDLLQNFMQSFGN